MKNERFEQAVQLARGWLNSGNPDAAAAVLRKQAEELSTFPKPNDLKRRSFVQGAVLGVAIVVLVVVLKAM